MKEEKGKELEMEQKQNEREEVDVVVVEDERESVKEVCWHWALCELAWKEL